MKMRLSTRLLSLLLVLALVSGLAAPAFAAAPTGGVTITQVDNSEVSVNPLNPIDEELHTMDEYIDTDVVRVSIILEKASTIKAGFSSVDIAQNKSAMAYRETLKSEQNKMVASIEKAIAGKLDVVWNLTLAANLISANVRYGQIEAIKAVAGVKDVVIEQQYVVDPVETEIVTNMATSGAQTGSGLAWAAGYTGAGTRIAVIDTGSDTDHQSLNAAAFEYALAQLAQKKGMSVDAYVESLDLLDAEEIASVAGELNVTIDPATAYVSSKLPFGYNYKDQDYDITHDNDEQGEHGSHVAGIATANSYIAAEDGAFVDALETVFVKGVAPEAQLITMKVFGKDGSPYDSDYMTAIEDAIILGADAVNLSLGSVAPGRGSHANPVLEQIMDDITASGTVVAVSAGNSGAWAENAENGGYLYNTDVNFTTVGQPGSFTNSLAVASVENDGMVGYYVQVGDEMIVYNEDNRDGEFSNKLFREISGEYEYIFIDGVGKEEDWAAVADVLPGKIALCSRGETNFVDKAHLAIDAGAIAVFIYNNQSGMITLDLTEYQYTNPVAALSQQQGAAIRAASTPVLDDSGNVRYLTGKMTVSNVIGLGTFDSEYYTMSSFSSWGVPGSLELKPELTAPGGNIYSLNGLDKSGDGYEIMSGTSMASPQVAGMAALMAQYVRENGLAETTGMSERHLIQSLLMSTAEPLQVSEGVYYPVIQQGAGMANVYDAMDAGSYITMAPGSSSGDADGKIKVELYDDPGRTGSYGATFTVNNLENAAKVISLNADFFTQALLSDGEHDYMDYATALLGMDVIWTVDGQRARTAEPDANHDFNGDGTVNTADGQALLDYATGVRTALSNFDHADVDADGDVDSHDAYVFLRGLTTTSALLPAGGSVTLSVKFSLTDEAREALEASFPNGNYIQGYLFADVAGDVTHSIPVFGFYGNWTDPGMFDVGQWTTYATGEDTRIPYIGRTRGNDFQIVYDWDQGYSYSFGGNPVIADSVYMPERNAINSADAISGVRFIAIRHADQSRVTVTNETSGKTILDVATGAVNMAYYYGALGWQNSGLTLTTNFPLDEENEGDLIEMGFTLIPEYYIAENGEVDFEALGEGATLSTTFTIDNTAPELFGVSIDLMTNSMTVKASDNNYIAAVGLYNKTGTRVLAQTGAKQDIEKGEVAEYSFSLDKVNGKKFLLQVMDYAMNRATYLIEMQIGESTDLPTMMAYDLVSHHWAGFDNTFEYDYKVGTPRVAYSDHVIFAATIAEHYVFASTHDGDLYVMPEDDLSDITFITDMEMVLYDMAYNVTDGEIYAVNERGELVSFHKLSGDVNVIGQIGVNTNTLACSPEGVFYCNELGTGKVYSFTLQTMDEPELLMEDPFLTYVDPIAGADMGGTTGNMGMEYDMNTGKICWNSHCEVLVGSYITYAYYYEIDPESGEFTRYNDFWHEMAGLIIPVRSGADKGWAAPTDEVMAVKLNRDQIDVIRGTSFQLSANVQPWTATDRTVTWTSADESVATVNKHGLVTGVSAGTTTIRATSNLDPTMYAECVVNVELLEVTLHGTVTDEGGSTTFYDWNMATGENWTAGAAIDHVMTSATYSTLENAFYMMDADGAWQMHKVGADGKAIASADNTNGIPLWDMAYNEYFTQLHGKEQVSSVYYYYLLSPKDPMALDAVGFDLSNLADYLVGIASAGYEQMEDEDGNLIDTEHLVLLDNDGYIWDFWIYDVPGGMNAMYSIHASNMTCEFPGDETLDHMYTSLVVGDDGNLYVSAFNGSTNEVWHLSYDEIDERYNAVMVGTMGADVWPASITSVTVNGTPAAAASPAPTATMSAKTISESEFKAASSRAAFVVSEEELAIKTNADGSEADPTPFAIGANTVTAPKTGYFFTYTAANDGTATISSEGTDWRATVYINGELSGNSVHNPKYDGSEITKDLLAGDTLLFKITPYSGWSSVEREITVNFAYSGEGGSEPDPTDPVDPTDPSEPEEPDTALSLGENTLASGSVYTYTAESDGRLEFDFSGLTDSTGATIYQYAYGKGTRVKIFVNGEYLENLADTKLTVAAGDEITVELQSVDGDTYSAILTLSALEPAAALAIGDNAIAMKADYSFIAEQDGKLYTTIKELWVDGTYCTEATLSSTAVFKINGKAVYGFQNAYDVVAGDEITVLLSTQFGEPANALLNLSWEGFYEHPIGSRGNPYTLTYASCPTESAEIPAESAVWYRLSGFGAGYNLVVTGEDACVIVGNTQVNAENGVVSVPAATNLRIGNLGTEAATFTLSASIDEGYPDNPKDLVEGDNTVTVDKSDNFYYDFVAEQDGTATFTVSGENWRFWYSFFNADGTAIVSEEDHRQARSDADTITVEMKAGESIVLKLGTMTSSWTAPGGELTVSFHFEADEVYVPANPLVLGKNDLTSGVTYEYVVPADGRMEFAVGSVYNSAGSKQYSWYNGSKLSILVDGKAMTASSAKRNVTAGEIITVVIESLDGDTYTADITLKELEPAVALKLGENAIAQDLEHLYVAEQDGTLYISVIEMLYNGNAATESDLGNNIQYQINGSSVSSFERSLEVKAGDEVTVVIKDYSWDGSGVVSANIQLSYEGFYEHPAGSINNPVELLYADLPTKSIEIAAGSTAYYQLEGDPVDFMTAANYPFKGKTLVVTGENAYIIVGSTRYDAENGAAKVLMGEQTLIQIGNAGNSASVFGISVEIPEGHVDNPQDLVEGENKVTLPSYGTHYFDYTAAVDGTVTVTVSGENWKYNFAHYAADGSQVSAKDYYAKNGDEASVTQELKAGEKIVVMVGTSKGYSQPGGDITVSFHFEPAEAPCAHANTEIRDAKDATCTESGYTGDTWCLDCGEKIAEGTVIEATGHEFVEGICIKCGAADPDYVPDNSVAFDVILEQNVTNGVVEITWDAALLTLTDINVHADYESILMCEGSVTFGYVSLMGIPAGKSIATLTFEAVDPDTAAITIVHKQINNESQECDHAWSDWNGNQRECVVCGVEQINPFVDVPTDSFFIDPVMWAVEEGITTGTSADTFDPNKACVRAQAVTFLWRAAGSPEPVSSINPFVDVSEDAFYYKAVLWAVEQGITNGISADHFGPMTECSRSQIVTFLWRAEGSSAVDGEHPFTDVEAGSFYETAVAWAAANGVASGLTATTFGPNAICNRAQIVTFLYRAYA